MHRFLFPLFLAMVACSEDRPTDPQPSPSPTPTPVTPSSKKAHTKLVAWTWDSTNNCKVSKTTCERDWDASPLPEDDPCFPMMNNPPQLKPELPSSAHFVYTLSQPIEGVVLSGDIVFDMGDGAKIKKAPTCGRVDAL